MVGFSSRRPHSFSIAGKTLTLEPQAQWLAAGDPVQEQDEETREHVGRVWEPEHGDRRQETVFIGADMHREQIELTLTAALLTENEFSKGPETWKSYSDPFAAMFAERELAPA